MKYPTEKSKKYPGLEQLSTAELEALLRRDFAASGDDDASMALITEIMEVIQAREAQQDVLRTEHQKCSYIQRRSSRYG